MPLSSSDGGTPSAKQSVALNLTTSVQTRSVETFTQTSKTIIELAKTDCLHDTNTLETQTSFVCITERTVQYTSVQYSDHDMKCVQGARSSDLEDVDHNGQLSLCLDHSLEDCSSKGPESKGSDGSKTAFESDSSSNDEIVRIIQGECLEDAAYTEPNITNLSPKSSGSDFDDDSLAEFSYKPRQTSLNNSVASSSSSLSELSKSVDQDVRELYSKLSGSMEVPPSDRSAEVEKKKFGMLTPLSEESLTKKTSTANITPSVETLTKQVDNDVLFTNDCGIRVKMLQGSTEPFKLPPIQRNLSCRSSPHLSLLFSNSSNLQPLCKAETLPCLFAGNANSGRCTNTELASGESVHITGRNGK